MDMLAHAIDTPPPASIILVSGDRDFAYAVSTLRLRRYRVVVISAGEVPVHPSLKAHASVFLDWHADVLLAKIVDESRHFHLRSTGDEARSLATSSPSRRYPRSTSPFSVGQRFMDHIQHDTHMPRGSGAALERGLQESNTAASSNRSLSPNDSRVVEAQSPTPTLRAPSRTESAPATVCSSSEILPQSRVFTTSSTRHDFNDNKSTPATLPIGPQAPSKASTYFLPSPQIKSAQELKSGNMIIDHLSTLLPDSTSFSVQYPHQPLPPGVPISTSNASVSPYFENVKPASPVASVMSTVDSSKERPTATVRPSKSIPPGFEPLVQRLEIYRSQGVLRPYRSNMAVELATHANEVYRRVGAKRFGQYANMAVKAGIVELGGREGGAWIALRPEWYYPKPS